MPTPISVSLSRGIDGISSLAKLEKAASFPVDKAWQTPLGAPESHVAKLYHPNNALQQLEDFAKPKIAEWRMLIPFLFKRVRDALLLKLRSTLKGATASGDSQQASHTSMAQLLEVLAREEEYEAQVDRYRHALIKP